MNRILEANANVTVTPTAKTWQHFQLHVLSATPNNRSAPNEELQSTNEELETMNEELETIDDEPRGRTGEAMGANAFLRAILASVHQGVVVLDADLRVLAWSEAAVDLWGLRADEVVGRHFLDLDIGLPVAELRWAIRQVLLTDAPHEVKVEARDGRGQPVLCAVSFARLTAPTGQVDGVILVMTAERRDERA